MALISKYFRNVPYLSFFEERLLHIWSRVQAFFHRGNPAPASCLPVPRAITREKK
jgi:hypothetical protein